jgi:hypothetical protein
MVKIRIFIICGIICGLNLALMFDLIKSNGRYMFGLSQVYVWAFRHQCRFANASRQRPQHKAMEMSHEHKCETISQNSLTHLKPMLVL